MKSIEDIDHVLCLNVERKGVHKKLKLSQETYTKKVMERFGMTDCCQPLA